MASVGGDIELMPVADAAVWAAGRRLTGTLSVRRRNIEAHFTLRHGVCVQASSSDPREYLGQHLINFNHIDEDQLQRAFDTQKETHVPLGRVLVMVDAITPDQLQQVLKFKTREGLLEVLCWTEGNWRLSLDVEEDTELDCELPIDLREVASEAAARQQMWTEIRRVFPSDATRVDVLADPDLVDSPFDRRLLQLMQTGRSVGEAALELRAMDFQTYARLYDLATRNLVRPLLTATTIRIEDISPQALASSGASIVTGPQGKPMLIPRAATPAQTFPLVVPRLPSVLSGLPPPAASSSTAPSSTKTPSGAVPAALSFASLPAVHPSSLPTSTDISRTSSGVAAASSTSQPPKPASGPPVPVEADAEPDDDVQADAPVPSSRFAVPAAFAVPDAPTLPAGPAFPSTSGIFPRPTPPSSSPSIPVATTAPVAALTGAIPSPFANVPAAPRATPQSAKLPPLPASSAPASSTRPPSSSKLKSVAPGDDDEVSFAGFDEDSAPQRRANRSDDRAADDDLAVDVGMDDDDDGGIDVRIETDVGAASDVDVDVDVDFDEGVSSTPALAPFPSAPPAPTATTSTSPSGSRLDSSRPKSSGSLGPGGVPKSTTPVGSYFGAGTYMMVKPERATEAPGVKIPPEAENPAQALRLALAGRNWSEAFLLSQRILEHDPLDSEAIAAFRVADAQLRRIEKQGGPATEADFSRVPTLAMARDEVALSHLTSKERYVLSRVDGRRSLEQIAAVSPIQRQELLRIVDSFVQRGVLQY